VAALCTPHASKAAIAAKVRASRACPRAFMCDSWCSGPACVGSLSIYPIDFSKLPIFTHAPPCPPPAPPVCARPAAHHAHPARDGANGGGQHAQPSHAVGVGRDLRGGGLLPGLRHPGGQPLRGGGCDWI
jgi:hypothetical protein